MIQERKTMSEKTNFTGQAGEDLEGVYNEALVKSLLLSPERIQRYPLASKYDPKWIFDNEAGSHCLWLMEALCQELELKPGMRVLDLGCGSAIESIFLAKEFGVQVWATDLGFNPSDNLQRICQAGVQDNVFPIKANARDLPYAQKFFDVAVSINSLQLYATDDLFLSRHLIPLVKPDGQIGVVVPGLRQEFYDGVPEYIKPYWDNDFYCWHSPDWWRTHWLHTGLVDVRLADLFSDGEGYTIFNTWGKVMQRKRRLVDIDGGRNISFVRVITRVK